jgi:undecaprenyl-diphosphatase
MPPSPQESDAPRAPFRLDRYQSLLKPLLVGLAAALLALAFVQLGSEIVEGDTRSFDMHFLRSAQSLRVGHPWVAEVMRDLSGLG